MRFLARIVLSFIANTFALLLAAYLLSGFMLQEDPLRVAFVAAMLTLINLLVKPFLKLLASPLIILTFGLALFFVNALILYVLDFLSEDLTIEGIHTLLLATILLGAVNFVTHLATRSK